MRYSDKVEIHARSKVSCSRCGAEPGDHCKVVTGRSRGDKAPRVHVDRWNRAWTQMGGPKAALS